MFGVTAGKSGVSSPGPPSQETSEARRLKAESWARKGLLSSNLGPTNQPRFTLLGYRAAQSPCLVEQRGRGPCPGYGKKIATERAVPGLSSQRWDVEHGNGLASFRLSVPGLSSQS